MKRVDAELLVGAAVALVALAIVLLSVGARGLLYIIGLAVVGAIALSLWQSKERGARVLAACLVPMLAIGHLLSKVARSAIQRFKGENSE